jgi:O-succinylbenzoic acid--CoA ligase
VLRTVAAAPGAELDLLTDLRRALDGNGPALLPLPPDTRPRDVLLEALRPDLPLEETPGGDRIALVVPTSGSTGKPKGVLLSAHALKTSAAATQERLGGTGQWLLALPVTHIAGLQVLIRSLLLDTVPVIVDSKGGFTSKAFLAAVSTMDSDRRYTSLVPTQLARLLDDGGTAVDALAGFEAVLVGGAATSTTLHDRATAAGIRLVTSYGMTETCGGCVYDGVPLDQVTISLGENGRITLNGPMLFSGYRLRPSSNESPLSSNGFLTRDLGQFGSDGKLEILGRMDDAIMTGGEKVAPAAVEEALLTHSGVRDVAVVGIPDLEWGERIVAVVVPVSAVPPSVAALREQVATRLGRHAAPREILIVSELPRMGLGKIDREAVRRIASR